MNPSRFLLLAASLLFLQSTSFAQATAPSFDATPRIAIISAFDAELDKLKATAQISETKVINGRHVYVGKLEGHDVVMTLSGYSMVNAAMTTQALIDRYALKGIVFSGIAGGVNPGLHVGDVTIPARWGNYQESVFARKTKQGYDTGEFPAEFKNYGMMFPRSSSVPKLAGPADVLDQRFWFEVNPTALDKAKTLAGRIKLHRCTASGECLTKEPRLVVGGNGVSGPSFVDNAQYRLWVWQTFHADALDMETAAVAHVAYVNRIPYIAFRSLSDLAGGGQEKNEMQTFGKLAADNSASLVIEYLKLSGPSPFEK